MADAQTIPCIIRGKITAIKDAKGIERVSNQIMVVAENIEFDVQDYFTIRGKKYNPLHLAPYYNEIGKLAGWEIYF